MNNRLPLLDKQYLTLTDKLAYHTRLSLGGEMILIIKKGELMVITRQNPNGGPTLKGFPLEEDKETGVLGYKVGYCEHGDPLLIRTIDIRQVVAKFGGQLDEYDTALYKLRKKEPLRERIIRFLGGRTD